MKLLLTHSLLYLPLNHKRTPNKGRQLLLLTFAAAMTNTLYFENAIRSSNSGDDHRIPTKSEKKSMFESIFRKKTSRNDKRAVNIIHISREDKLKSSTRSSKDPKINPSLSRKLSNCSSNDSKDPSAFCC
mmetsp:Transcript_31699/g.47910  ORF Transcript_31699/g.47910 Transcript_31699/m.47910 type:complete len:130 (-) Transcript_31699:2573-2962(-)